MFTQKQEQFLRQIIKEECKNAIKEVKQEEQQELINYNKEVADMYGSIFEAQGETK